MIATSVAGGRILCSAAPPLPDAAEDAPEDEEDPVVSLPLLLLDDTVLLTDEPLALALEGMEDSLFADPLPLLELLFVWLPLLILLLVPPLPVPLALALPDPDFFFPLA